ncbi:MAG: amidohydrolase family protein [Gemmatimonadota bacterium]|jgi:imidazolonepropionase-like amidohydrolase|nr:amidohydrolase family protein [Gemmatimonadota bacterium]
MIKRFFSAAAAAAVLGAAPVAAQTVAIEGGTVHTMTGAPIEGGTVLIRDGRIVAVGRNVSVPAGAQRIDARGKMVTPGLFDSGTNLGLVEIDAVVETNDFRAPQEEDDLVAAAFNVADGLNPNSMVIPITRVAGVTTAVSRPQGGLIAGQGVVIDLLGRDMDAMLVRTPVAMYGNLGESARGAIRGSRGSTTLRLREVLQDARAYARDRGAYERGGTRELAVSRSDLESLQDVLARRIPLVLEAHRASDITTALRLAREFNFRLIIDGGTEAWMVADELAAARVPVIVKVLNNLPNTFATLGATYENAARLRRAGVQVAVTSGETFKSFNLRQEAGNAVAYGLPHDEALRAITLYPAQIWGLDGTYGSLAPGKVANVVVWGGDPLEMLTPVEHVFIRGREVPLTSRETELRDRYLRLDDRTRAYPRNR